LLAFSAIRNGIGAVITRNEKDFCEAEMTVINPKDIGRRLGRYVEGGNVVIDNTFDNRRYSLPEKSPRMCESNNQYF